jgi:hypothetical protein
MKQFALCIHDMRASDGKKIPEVINYIREVFNIQPVTVHLIMDKYLEEDDETFLLLKKEVERRQLEIVFHGVSHTCPPGTARFFSWYHKNNAEFMSHSFNVETNRLRYNRLNDMFNSQSGFCPPCWIAGQVGWKFIKSLSPLYIEKLLSVNSDVKTFFSLPVSLATDNKKELFFLRKLASLISAAAIVIRHSRLRLVVHTVDLTLTDSVNFLCKNKSKLLSKGFTPVLLKEFIV